MHLGFDCLRAAVGLWVGWLVAGLILPGATARSAEPPAWQDYFSQQVAAYSDATDADLAEVTPENWPGLKSQWRGELRQMLGLPAAEHVATAEELKVTITDSLKLPGLRIDKLHYQTRPGLYVTSSLYIPDGQPPEAGWPAVLYVCGHSRAFDYGRLLGNKTGYHHHGLWFARHGLACLMIDTVQLGELHGEHHGTYKLGRWDWLSAGYTPAGVEAANAIRAVDLLCGLPDINASKIGVTGRSGGGIYSWLVTALDDRIRVAVPVAGITDLENHILDGCIEGHCDCMFFVNYFGWDYAKLAALAAPRPLLLANSDSDTIFPLDGVLRIHASLTALYKQLDASNKLGLVITPGPHKDTQELQVAAFRWLLKTLQDDADPVVDMPANKGVPPADLVVFEREIPKDQTVTSASGWFADLDADAGQNPRQSWRDVWLPKLIALGTLPAADFDAVAFEPVDDSQSDAKLSLLADDAGLGIRILKVAGTSTKPARVNLSAGNAIQWRGATALELSSQAAIADALKAAPGVTQYFVHWRGADWFAGPASVKARHHLVRRFYLLGQSPEGVALRDALTAIRWINRTDSSYALVGQGRQALLVRLIGLLAEDEDYQIGKPEMILASEVPSDPNLVTAIPGLLRVCRLEDLLAASDAFLQVTDTGPASGSPYLVDPASEPQQANGMRIVEVGQDRAQVWLRSTLWPLPNLGDLPTVKFEQPAQKNKRNIGPLLPTLGADGLQFAVPGTPGTGRVGYRKRSGGQWSYSDWVPLGQDSDFSNLIALNGLTPGTAYSLRTEVRAPGSQAASSVVTGSFTTLPATDSESGFRLAVGTCQAFGDRDGPHGFDVYRTIQRRNTDAFVMAGDVVYYDALARSTPLAYYHWQRTYSLPTLVEFHKHMPTFFLKDDHDTYVNDSWPGVQHAWTGDFSFSDGQRIFKQQTGLPSPGYRTVQVNRNLQVWLLEGRDYRSANNAPDGPEKSIWGQEQKEWLQRTLAASTAKFKVVVSPTPIVGPDRANKSDNHSNAVFAAEGVMARQMLADIPNTVVVCGDRHWQYHSLDPETGLHEFSVGPVSDRHAGGWKKDDFRPEIHQFMRVGGGYLEATLSPGPTATLTLRHLDVSGNELHTHIMQ